MYFVAIWRIGGTVIDPAPQSTSPAIAAHDRDRLARAGLVAYRRLVDHWQLSNEEAAALIDVTDRTWARMKKPDWSGRLSRDQLLRLSALIGLYKALHLFFAERLADAWAGRPNDGPLFRGERPVAWMIAGGLPAIMAARDYVDALRGGV